MEYFDSALYLLNETIVQLRAYYGFLTLEPEKPIAGIKDFILSYIGKSVHF